MLQIKKGENRFFVGDSEEQALAEMTFTEENGLVYVEHTNVSDALRGQNAGRQLLKGLVDWARTESKTIIPVCPFVKAEVARNKDYEDVLKK